jgi:hypothetical protein
MNTAMILILHVWVLTGRLALVHEGAAKPSRS